MISLWIVSFQVENNESRTSRYGLLHLWGIQPLRLTENNGSSPSASRYRSLISFSLRNTFWRSFFCDSKNCHLDAAIPVIQQMPCNSVLVQRRLEEFFLPERVHALFPDNIKSPHVASKLSADFVDMSPLYSGKSSGEGKCGMYTEVFKLRVTKTWLNC